MLKPSRGGGYSWHPEHRDLVQTRLFKDLGSFTTSSTNMQAAELLILCFIVGWESGIKKEIQGRDQSNNGRENNIPFNTLDDDLYNLAIGLLMAHGEGYEGLLDEQLGRTFEQFAAGGLSRLALAVEQDGLDIELHVEGILNKLITEMPNDQSDA